jgi:hypothetical protein
MGRLLQFQDNWVGHFWPIGAIFPQPPLKEMLRLHGSQTGWHGANGIENAALTAQDLIKKESAMKPDICIITRVCRTIGADRGRAARGAPKRD